MRKLFSTLLLAVSLTAATHGPPDGWLIIIGGGKVGPEIWDRIFTLCRR